MMVMIIQYSELNCMHKMVKMVNFILFILPQFKNIKKFNKESQRTLATDLGSESSPRFRAVTWEEAWNQEGDALNTFRSCYCSLATKAGQVQMGMGSGGCYEEGRINFRLGASGLHMPVPALEAVWIVCIICHLKPGNDGGTPSEVEMLGIYVHSVEEWGREEPGMLEPIRSIKAAHHPPDTISSEDSEDALLTNTVRVPRWVFSSGWDSGFGNYGCNGLCGLGRLWRPRMAGAKLWHSNARARGVEVTRPP